MSHPLAQMPENKYRKRLLTILESAFNEVPMPKVEGVKQGSICITPNVGEAPFAV